MIVSVKGFSLIECLIYCAIAGCMSVMVFSFFNRSMNGVRLFSAKQQEIVAQWSVQQLVRKDIQSASCDPADWHSSGSALVCKIGDDSIGWHSMHGNLYRTKGNYNFGTNKWLKKSTALVAKGVMHFESTLHPNKKMIEAVSYKFAWGPILVHKKTGLLGSMGDA